MEHTIRGQSGRVLTRHGYRGRRALARNRLERRWTHRARSVRARTVGVGAPTRGRHGGRHPVHEPGRPGRPGTIESKSLAARGNRTDRPGPLAPSGCIRRNRIQDLLACDRTSRHEFFRTGRPGETLLRCIPQRRWGGHKRDRVLQLLDTRPVGRTDFQTERSDRKTGPSLLDSSSRRREGGGIPACIARSSRPYRWADRRPLRMRSRSIASPKGRWRVRQFRGCLDSSKHIDWCPAPDVSDGGVSSGSTSNARRRKRSTPVGMASADFTHRYGFGSVFVVVMKARMSRSGSSNGRSTTPRMARAVGKPDKATDDR